MKITIVQTGAVPSHLQAEHEDYPQMFRKMFASTGVEGFSFDDIDACGPEPLPDPTGLEAILITGSPAGVYEDHHWLDPLRDFIRAAYAANIPMLGVCFGHQIIADALGGDVRKSEKGWGLGRHTYAVAKDLPFAIDLPAEISVACSHQDQVITPPGEARVFLSSPFAPNAGLAYANGVTLTLQPHPEFEDSYAQALVEMRRGRATDDVIETALNSMQTSSDTMALRHALVRFFGAASSLR
jgi:GMP synthase-like glutamine amidotransferase